MNHVTLLVGGAERSFDAALVRSWCRCGECGDTTTGKRWVSPTDIPADVQPARVEQSGSRVQVDWSDGHRSAFDLDLVIAPMPAGGPSPSMPIGPIPRFDHAALMADDAVLFDAVGALATAGVIHVVDGPAEAVATVPFAERFGPIRVTSYGQVQVFITDTEARTAAHTGVGQHPHTDEPFRYCPPGFLFFHSVESAPPGEGTSTLVDGFAAAERLRATDPAAFDWLAATPVEFHRRHEHDVSFSTRSRVITTSPEDGAVEALRINHRCLAPVDPDGADARRTLEAIRALSEIVEDPDNHTRLHLEAGEFLVFDNHRIMHGRTAFSDVHPRHLRSCNVDRDEVHSRYRVLGEQLGRPLVRLARGAVS